MRKRMAILIGLVLIFSFVGCSVSNQSEKSDPSSESHKIGVIVYNLKDEEVQSFRNYLENYIAEVFPGITFLYSDSIRTEEEELSFIQDACDAGVEGFLSFLVQDLKQEVELCAKNKVYYMAASGSVTDEAFREVEDNPYFIGIVGPGSELEYKTGADMADFFVGQAYGNEYFILSGGSAIGNDMHLQRTIGILDKLQERYGVTFDKPSEELASSGEHIHIEAGDLKVAVMPGYIAYDEFFETARKEYEGDKYPVVLSVLPIAKMAPVVKGSHLGVVDCYSETNLQMFSDGYLSYVAGKYSSIVGPSFAAMYNALTGYAEDFRENGKAFRLVQGFWYSDSYDDYVDKYTLATSIVKNAYNYEDLGKVCKVFNPEATLDDLKELIQGYTYDDAKARRGE